MFSVTESAAIRRSIDEVFHYIADARNRPDWDATVVSEELTSPEPIGLGTTVHSRLRAIGGVYDYDWRITEFVVPSRIVIESTSGTMPTVLVFTLKRHVDTTVLTSTIEGRPAGVMRLLQPMLARSTRANLAAGMARLPGILESRGAH